MGRYRTKKRFGQHFLISASILDRLIAVIAPAASDTIVEIGPGQGVLTERLAASGASVIGVEMDHDLIGALESRLKQYDSVVIKNRNFLKASPDDLCDVPFRLVGNIPYNITSPVIDWCCRNRQQILSVVLMVQKDFASRLASSPGCKDWAPISIFSQMSFDIHLCFDVPPDSFEPPPKVMSAVVRLDPRQGVWLDHPEQFERLVRTAFAQRRKLLINNLAPSIVDDSEKARELLAAVGLDATCRAEQLSIDQFLILTEQMVADKIRIE
ncbi:MAG: 16S rRNA (adenine(1518)-N(6)/adenine(1519)-N(6))-dimethyltransferase RsmA [Candidatus Zixiibacteriota bacterium]